MTGAVRQSGQGLGVRLCRLPAFVCERVAVAKGQIARFLCSVYLSLSRSTWQWTADSLPRLHGVLQGQR